MTRISRWIVALGLVAFLPLAAWAVNPASWQVDLTTTGNDVYWTSPTAVTTGLALYDWSYEITEVIAHYSFFGIPGSTNVVGQLGDAAMGSGTVASLPLVIVDELLSEPTTGSSAHIRIEVDAAGYGRASATEITLGSYLGAQITRVDLKANISMFGVEAGDYTRNGIVDVADYGVWKSNFGSTSNLSADGNGNHVVDAADYTVWRDHATSGPGGASLTAAVPEPAAAWLLGAGVALLGHRRRRISVRKLAKIA